MTKEMQFKEIVAQYCDIAPEKMTNDMRFREDLGFSSLDFMAFLGELEDTFDLELEEQEILKVVTIEEALALLDTLDPRENSRALRRDGRRREGGRQGRPDLLRLGPRSVQPGPALSSEYASSS